MIWGRPVPSWWAYDLELWAICDPKQWTRVSVKPFEHSPFFLADPHSSFVHESIFLGTPTVPAPELSATEVCHDGCTEDAGLFRASLSCLQRSEVTLLLQLNPFSWQ